MDALDELLFRFPVGVHFYNYCIIIYPLLFVIDFNSNEYLSLLSISLLFVSKRKGINWWIGVCPMACHDFVLKFHVFDVLLPLACRL